MPSITIGGRIYEEIAVTATDGKPLPVDIQAATLNLSGDITVGNVTVDNDSLNPVPVSDNGSTLSVDDGGGSITVDGPLTDTQLRASAVEVTQASQPLPTGAATSALQTTGNSSLSTINGKLPSLVGSRIPVDGSGVTQPVSDAGGSLTVDDGGGSITVDGPLTDAQLRATPVAVGDGGGSLTVDGSVSITGVASVTAAARTPTTTSVAGAASSVLILALNANRKGLSVSNISTSKLYLSFSNPATVGNSFIEMQPGSFLLFDQQLIVANAIYGIWTNANGAAQVTEYV
jgi:precorrin-6B methylase 2